MLTETSVIKYCKSIHDPKHHMPNITCQRMMAPADVEQTDIHMPRTTVHEALQISGLLRLHKTSREVVEVFVSEVGAH